MKNIISFLTAAGIAAVIFSGCLQNPSKANLGVSPASQSPSVSTSALAPSITHTPTPMPIAPAKVTSEVRFSATGDNLIHEALYNQANQRADGNGYDFSFCYSNLAQFYQQFDLNWINQETLITDTLSPSTYPCFSSPGDLGRNLYDIGFRAFSISNNHTYDKGATGIADTIKYWNSMPDDITVSGLYTDEDENNGIILREQNNIVFAFLSYTEYTNGIPTPQNCSAHVIYTSELSRIQKQVELASQLADFVIISCHWGVEDSHIVTDAQMKLAENLAEWGADLIIGTHPHVIQSAQILDCSDGRNAFVVYSLGNSLSAQSRIDEMIGGILEVTFEKTVDQSSLESSLSMKDFKIHPIVNHYENNHNNIRLFLLSQYSDDLASVHGVREKYPQFSIQYISALCSEIFQPFLV